MKKILLLNNKKVIGVFFLIVMIMLIFVSTYALKPEGLTRRVAGKILKIDEEVYGETHFNSNNLDFRPILDNDVNNFKNNVIHIDFIVGGSELNEVDNIVYDIALVDLNLDCSLISPYLKWKLLKNGKLISEGSLDYKFDTIDNGRLVLTEIQQDLKDYNEDKTTYDNFDFYMWLSDSCQSKSLLDCLEADDQSNLLGKRIKGKIEVELYATTPKKIVRKPSDILNTDNCVVGSGDEVYVNR